MDYSRFFLFNGLSENERNKITKEFCAPQKFKKGEIIYSNTVFNNAIGFIVKGKAYAVSNNQNETYLKTFNANMCFGAAAVFGGDDCYISTITAKTECEILFLTEPQLRQIFEKYPQTAVNYITFLSDKVRFLNNKLSVVSCMSAEDAVLTQLQSTQNSEGYAEIPKNMTLFAKMLGLSRATLYRVLDTLEQNGSILRENNKVKVIKNEKTN